MNGSTQMRDCFKMGKCRKDALSIIVLSLFISAISAVGIAQESQLVGSLQTSNLAAGTKTAQSRYATLQELYGMFFTYAEHVETKADADEKLGNDRSFYRQHLQIASGLTTDEYAQILVSAQRFSAVDADVKAQLAESIEAGASSGQIASLFEQRDSSLKTEIANVRQLLGQDRADIFEAYLQNEYIQQGSSPAPSQTQVSSPTFPSFSSSFTAPPSSLQVSAQAAISTESTAETVAAIGSQECKTGYTLFYNGSYDICADSQLSYLGSGNVEPYAQMSFSYNNIVLDYLEIQGYFYVNGVFNTNLGCYTYSGSGNSCQHSPYVTLASGNGALYQWYGKTTIGAYDVSCSSPSSCYETVDSEWSDPAEVQIYYPDINYISPNSVTPGDTGKTFTIDGEGLISPFQNTPTVTVTNQGSVFSNFYVQSFNYAAGTITIGYSVLSTASAGTQTITVNNGFGSGSATVTVIAPPTINGPNGSISPRTPTSVYAGQRVSLSVAAPSGLSIQSQTWSFGNSADAVGGFNASTSSGSVSSVTTTSNSNLVFYFIIPGKTETVTVNVTYSNGKQASATATFNVGGPTGNLLNAWMASNNQALQITTEPALSLTGSSYTENDGGNLGMVFQANSGQSFSSGSWVWVQLINSNQEKTIDSSGSWDCPADPKSQSGLDTTYPYSSGVSYMNDSPPSSMTGYAEYQRSFSATMYLMWDPQLPSSIPVPLESVSWGFSGCAINTLLPQNNGTTWTLQCGLAAPSTPQPSGYPEWQQLSPDSVTCSAHTY